VLKWSSRRRGFRIRRIVKHRVADIAVVCDDLSGIAHVFSVVATEAAGEIEVPDVVRMRLPISLHLWEKIGTEDSLNLPDGALQFLLFL